jgi:RNA polymerase sigma-70 factor (ECF subfamily)
MSKTGSFQIPSESLTRRARWAGDAFEEELLGLQKPLFFFAKILDPQNVEDLVQETNLRALKNREGYEPGTSMKAWLFKMMQNHHFDKLRRQRGKQFVALDDEIPGPDSKEPPADVHRQDGSNFIKECLPLLASRQREAVEIMLTVDPEEQQDVANIMGVSSNTLKRHLFRARRNMRARAMAVGFIL